MMHKDQTGDSHLKRLNLFGESPGHEKTSSLSRQNVDLQNLFYCMLSTVLVFADPEGDVL